MLGYKLPAAKPFVDCAIESSGWYSTTASAKEGAACVLFLISAAKSLYSCATLPAPELCGKSPRFLFHFSLVQLPGMITRESLSDFHLTYLPHYATEVPQSFSVHAIAPTPERPFVPYSRRDFYQINLFTRGTAQLKHGGETLQIRAPALVLHNPLVAYSCEAQTALAGYFCLFTTDFLHGPGYSTPLQESSLLRLNTHPVTGLTEAQSAFLSEIFQQMLMEVDSTYRHKYDLLRTYVQLILHQAQRLQPELQVCPTASGPYRLASLFVQTLEQQFPVVSPDQPLRLHTAEALAGHLGVHVNYLNRVLRQLTGRTTSAHLAIRVAQEAKALLQHTDWSIADIADSLHFADPTYFAHFFRKHVGTSPKAFRQRALLIPPQEN